MTTTTAQRTDASTTLPATTRKAATTSRKRILTQPVDDTQATQPAEVSAVPVAQVPTPEAAPSAPEETGNSTPTFTQVLDVFEPSKAASPYFQQVTVLITPDVAREILDEHKGRNRNLIRTTVDRYRSDIEQGVWTFAGDPLRFDIDGTLIDGQHRVSAVAELSDRSIALPFTVMLGLPPETILVIDQGTKRTAGQQLALRDMRNATAVAGAVRMVMLWEQGKLRGGFMRSATISTPQIEHWISENMDVIDYVNDQMAALRNSGASPAVATACAIILARIDWDAEKEFFTALYEGGEPKDSPITTLDKRFARMRRESATYRPEEYIGMIFRAWNAWRKGETLAKIIRPSEMTSFPIPL